jgi:hypothetical protein
MQPNEKKVDLLARARSSTLSVLPPLRISCGARTHVSNMHLFKENATKLVEPV